MLTNVFHRAVSVVAHKYLQQALLRTGPLFFSDLLHEVRGP